MRIKRLKLQNFRQFKDEMVQFSQDPDENVTVIHGPNGSGKTTLLNAFTWVLYGEVDFDHRPDRLANEGAMAEADGGDSVTAEVEFAFEHEGTEYEARRWIEYQKEEPNDFDGVEIDSDIVLEYTDDSGSMVRRDNPEVALEKIVPPRLSELFFFDGEDIDELAGIDNQEQIQHAIQNIMGLTILERAIQHLDDVAGRFEDEMKEWGSSELSDLIDEKRELQEKISEKEDRVGDIEKRVNELENEKATVESRLEDIDESAQLQERRKELRQDREELEDEIEEIEVEIRQEISDAGYLTFAMPAIKETAKDLDELRKQGKIPSELNTEFVDDLLEHGECICGRPLREDTAEYEAVRSYKSDASTEGVDQAAIRLISHLDEFTDRRQEFFETIEAKVETRKEKQEQIDTLTEKIDQIGHELEEMGVNTDKDEETPAELEARLQEIESERKEAIEEKGRIKDQIDDHKEEFESLKEEIDEAREEEEKARLARRRMKAAETTKEKLENSFQSLQTKVRDWSDALIKDTFEDIAQKNLKAEITEDFKLKIWQEVGDETVEVDKSTGERQIASLAFIGSLVSIAKQRYQSDSSTEYFTGGIYPIVMDSPFGALDMEHRRQVSRYIPELADQVVVMVTDSQWKGPVANEMESIAGEQYKLNFDDGEGADSYPRTRIERETATVPGDD